MLKRLLRRGPDTGYIPRFEAGTRRGVMDAAFRASSPLLVREVFIPYEHNPREQRIVLRLTWFGKCLRWLVAGWQIRRVQAALNPYLPVAVVFTISCE